MIVDLRGGQEEERRKEEREGRGGGDDGGDGRVLRWGWELKSEGLRWRS